MRRLTLLLIVLAGCGDDGNRHIIDAPQQLIDGKDVDAGLQPVTVTFTRDGAPVPDTRVYFQNPDQSVAASPMTDATGTASAVVTTGGSVTVVNTGTVPGLFNGVAQTRLSTWVGVKPGDHLLLRDDNPPYQTMTFVIPVDAANINIVGSYSIYTSCSTNPPTSPVTETITVGSGGPSTVMFSDIGLSGCNGTLDLLVVGNDTDGEPATYFFLPAQTVVEAGTLDLSAQTITWVAPAAHSYHITGYTGGFLQIFDQQATNRGVVYGHAANGASDPIDLPVNLVSIGGTRFIQLEDQQNLSATTSRDYIEWGGTLDPYMVDIGAHLLPALDSEPVLDTTSHILTWTTSGGSVASDFSIVSMQVARPKLAVWQWTIAGPGPGASIQMPVLPVDTFDYNAAAGDSTAFYGLVTAKVPGGYDGGRPVIFATTGPLDLVTGSAGSIVANNYRPQLAVARTVPRWVPRTAAPPTPTHVLRHRVR